MIARSGTPAYKLVGPGKPGCKKKHWPDSHCNRSSPQVWPGRIRQVPLALAPGAALLRWVEGDCGERVAPDAAVKKLGPAHATIAAPRRKTRGDVRGAQETLP